MRHILLRIVYMVVAAEPEVDWAVAQLVHLPAQSAATRAPLAVAAQFPAVGLHLARDEHACLCVKCSEFAMRYSATILRHLPNLEI